MKLGALGLSLEERTTFVGTEGGGTTTGLPDRTPKNKLRKTYVTDYISVYI
jgi:hypothetical protein